MGSVPSDELITELYVQAERTATRVVGRDRAEDVASEVVVRALVRWSRISGYPHAWVTKVATNLAIDVLRKEGRAALGTGSAPPPSFEATSVQRLDLVRWLRRLSRRQRQTVVLHYLGGFTDEEVSEVLGLSVPTVKTHLRRALSAMRRLDGTVREESDASTDPT